MCFRSIAMTRNNTMSTHIWAALVFHAHFLYIVLLKFTVPSRSYGLFRFFLSFLKWASHFLLLVQPVNRYWARSSHQMLLNEVFIDFYWLKNIRVPMGKLSHERASHHPRPLNWINTQKKIIFVFSSILVVKSPPFSITEILFDEKRNKKSTTTDYFTFTTK